MNPEKRSDKPKGPHTNEPTEVKGISPHNEAIYEAGKTILIDSIRTGREFCQSMIKISIGAIPIYLGVLGFILPSDYSLDVGSGLVMALPAIVFLVASMLFTLGYLPIKVHFSLDIVEEVERERDKIIRRRSRLLKIGFTIFALATVMAITVIVVNIGAG